MEYEIICAPSLAQLKEAVQAAIKEGWAPCGGPSAIVPDSESGAYVCFQAMVRMVRPEPQRVQPVQIVPQPEQKPISHTTGLHRR